MTEPHRHVVGSAATSPDVLIDDDVFAADLGAGKPRRTPDAPITGSRRFQPSDSFQLARFDDQMARLLANVSHDLLTPLTRMRLRVETASSFSGQQKLIDDIDEMEGLVRDGLAPSGASCALPEVASHVEIEAFIGRLARDYADAGRSVAARAATNGTVVTKPRALRRILTNLVDNALKYAGAAEISSEVRSRTTMVISVLDRGPGIPSTHLLAAFERHCRFGRQASRPEGLGLGLAISKELSIALSGTLALRNRKGGGLAAELGIPL
ncbi:MAG: HAMP domain-containing sensor histidine kinase [Hansschlegelia sp.]